MIGPQKNGQSVTGDRNGSQLGEQKVHSDDTAGLMPRMLRHLFRVRPVFCFENMPRCCVFFP